MSNKIVSMKNISKSFSGIEVLKKVNFNIYKGKIMALLGENGAGKSTLMKILTGVYSKTSGNIYLNGEEVNFTNTKESMNKGIAIIHQELNLVEDLSIAENIFLGREPITSHKKIKWKTLYSETEKWLKKLGMEEDPRTIVKDLSVGKKQLIEIAKALSLNANIIIMDEPTGALTFSETKKLFQIIQELKLQGHSIVYISHRLNEIFEICDCVTILRDGELVAEKNIQELDEKALIEMMVGRKLTEQYPRISIEGGKVVLEVKNLTNEFINNISFSLKKGEILGIAGLVGAGRTKLARTIYGIYKNQKGKIFIEGKEVKIGNPKDALEHGIAYVSEDRKGNGIVVDLSVRENISLSSLKNLCGMIGNIDLKKEKEIVEEYIQKMSIKTSGINQLLRFLSGGNQQKVSIAKSLNTNPKILILDEPTRGVDIGAKKEIYDLMNECKKKGMSILMISSEISEILGISDRILVMYEGKMTGILNIEEASQERIMSLAVGKGVN